MQAAAAAAVTHWLMHAVRLRPNRSRSRWTPIGPAVDRPGFLLFGQEQWLTASMLCVCNGVNIILFCCRIITGEYCQRIAAAVAVTAAAVVLFEEQRKLAQRNRVTGHNGLVVVAVVCTAG